MKRLHISHVLSIALISIVLAGFMSGCTHHAKHNHTAAQQEFNDIEFWVKMFEDPERDEWQKPAEVVEHLGLNNGDVIADIGAGTGYFSRRFAVAVSPNGMAFGLDISSSMVQHMKEDAANLNLSNYKSMIIKPNDPELVPDSIDVVFLSNTYHHIENRVEYFKQLAESLKKNGRIVIVDFHENTPVGPQEPGHKIASKVVLDEFAQAGYQLIKSLDFLPYQYYLEFSL